MSDATADMSLQESCMDALKHLSVEIHLLIAKTNRLEQENAKLRKLMMKMADALGIDSEWADPNWCKSNCVLEFGCWPEEERTDILCPAWAAMRELGVEVTK